MDTVSDVLNRAADRLSRPGTWTQHKAARDFAGRECAPVTGGIAVCWCICGAVDVELQGASVAYEDVLKPLGGDKAAMAFNDATGRTQEEVSTWVRRGAARARKREVRA